MVSVKEYAYAKINLYLDVVTKRNDGFHDIKTVMHKVSLRDDITISVKRSHSTEIRLNVVGHPKLPTDSRNLAVKAAELFLTSTLINAEVDIRLVKRIPVAAGLAGGSADAAAVLRALNKAFKRPLTDKRLLELAARLGSDVPYCLVGGTALCYGRGERIERLPDGFDLKLVIAVADEYVSTPAAYDELDRIYSDFQVARDNSHELCLEQIIKAAYSGVLESDSLYNIFENAVFSTCIGAESIKRQMVELGATYALMSGSGPSVFGIFLSEKDARAAVDHFLKSGIRAFYTETIK